MSTKEDKLDEILFDAIEAAATYTHKVTAEEADYIQAQAKSDLNKLFKERFLELLPRKKQIIRSTSAQEPREFMSSEREITVNTNHQSIGYNQALDDIKKAFEDRYSDG